MASDFSELFQATATRWSGVAAPNAAALEMVEALVPVIAGFEALRGTLAFDDEPSSFEAALQAVKEA